ncbi:DUF1254 domain-containing protein [Mycobacterium sp. 852002-51057_SCH5723018]|uniref:DUF1254 domain-containing protein n=1 Tax=Mycobacterium sp. 852002-51057_SCH5723018 TaxID=1834094 RepID=UPI0007FDE86E|nr:DUF1254 domain-containing protein [Mycobacterium sp. 852002-51057_SCH5723018]OBG19316.1 hypothetical protein A5764_16910 [Mycobacterium sp. 852002-51057_SCH5723018]
MSTLSDDLQTLSHEAALYFYPLVLMDITRLQIINTPAGSKPGRGPSNEFHHMRAFPDAEFRVVVRPNFDTLYSSAFLDLTAGPVTVHAPDTDDRYYMLSMLDMWTDVFFNPGKRTTGTGAQDFVLTGPGYTGDLPADVPAVAAPTPFVWIIGRTQTNGPADYDAVHKVQNGYTITPVGQPPTVVIDPEYDTTTEPLRVANAMSAVEFFGYAANLLAVNPPHPTDHSILARIAKLGIFNGQAFDATGFTDAQHAEIEAGRTAAFQDMLAAAPTFGASVNGWSISTETMGVYGNYYLKRASVALVGLGANPAEDAVYPLLNTDSHGQPITGDNDYVLHFDADELPPAFAFWSITMYDAEGFQAANELNRFAIGDRDRLTYNGDGSLDLYIQHTNPGPDREANWLPAPRGPLGVTMRLYAPKPQVLNGRWCPPAIHKA